MGRGWMCEPLRRRNCSGDDDAIEEEQPQRDVAAPQRESEAGGEEAVVEPLIGGERRSRLGEVGIGVEHRLAERQGPGEHLQAEKAEVLERHQGGQDEGERFHRAALRGLSRARLRPIRRLSPRPVSLRAARG